MRGFVPERTRLLTLVLCAATLLASKCVGPSSSVVLLTESSTIGTGQVFTVEIAVSTTAAVQAYDLSVSWDPAYVQPTSVTPHADFDDDGLFFVPAAWGASSIEGIVDLRHGGAGQSGSFRVATIEFVSLSLPGDTTVQVSGGGVAQPDGSAVALVYRSLDLQVVP